MYLFPNPPIPGAPIDHKLGTKSVKCPPSPGRASTPLAQGGAREGFPQGTPSLEPQTCRRHVGPRRGPLGLRPPKFSCGWYRHNSEFLVLEGKVTK